MRPLQARFPDVHVPPSSLLIFIGILPLVDDFCLLADTAVQLLDFMQHTQLWCQANRVEIPLAKSKVVAFCETLAQRRGHAHLSWVVRYSFPIPSSHSVLEQAPVHYLGTTLDSGLAFMAHLKLIRSRIWLLTTNLLMLDHAPGLPSALGLLPFSFTSGTPRWPYTPSLTLVVLHAPAHRDQLQIILNKSLAATFHVRLTAIPCLHLEGDRHMTVSKG